MRSNWPSMNTSSNSTLPVVDYHYPSSSTLFARNKRIVIFTVIGLTGLILFLYSSPGTFTWPKDNASNNNNGDGVPVRGSRRPIDDFDNNNAQPSCRYSAQEAFLKYNEKSTEYRIAIIADMDTMSKTPEGKKWRSVMKKGVIRRDSTGHYSVLWKEEFDVFSALNEGGRGMELSDLTYFNGNLFTFDDRTGIVFKVVDKELLPYRILLDGNGKNTKGMKCEWATVKDGVMYVGSTGKEWTTPKGEFVNNNPLWVKTIDRQGNVGSEDWLDVFTKLRKATGTLYPGYLLHEAVRWNASQRRWYFIPRRSSELPYDEEADEERGTNLILSTDEDFGDVTVMRLGEVNPSHGFSAFQFVPYRENEVIALRTQEFKGTIASYIMAFDLDGNMLMEEELVGDVKFEGLEFI